MSDLKLLPAGVSEKDRKLFEAFAAFDANHIVGRLSISRKALQRLSRPLGLDSGAGRFKRGPYKPTMR